ncbi:MAG TPA: MraY family glycosyltransferase, partial [Dyella sp.]|uniref:glycosyltransferase family 4 protein n=1 Tax=Dyella sp. TaxID=1869338 RepID=UPI002D7669F5
MEAILAFVAAMGVTMVLIPPLMRAGDRLGIVDVPGGRKAHAAPIPRVGGIAMAAGMALGLLLVGQFEHRLLALAVGGLILVAFGVWDDRVALGAAAKFLGQVLAALAVMLLGGVKIATLTLWERQMLPDWIAWPLTLLFLIGATNAVNLADGLDGLAGGMILLCLCALTVLSWAVGQGFVIAAALSAAGAVFGFLRYNTHPARVFMGDAGSQLLGFAVAVLAIVLTQDPQSPLATALPLLLLGMPIIDTGAVMVERLLAGRSPFKADR